MTYEALELFKAVFSVAGKDAPLTSDYSSHLDGKRKLCVRKQVSRFVCVKVSCGKVPDDTPIVPMYGKDGSVWAFLFFKKALPNGMEQFHKVAKYYKFEYSECDEVELPFFNTDIESMCPKNPDGGRFRFLEEVLAYIASKSVHESDIDEWESTLPYSDAPFCVQSHYLCEGALPEFADTYLDSKELPVVGDSEWWKSNTKPMGCERLGTKCDKLMCRERKYGFESPEMTQLEFGELTQYAKGSVFYVWKINGNDVRFDSETQIMIQNSFLPVCMRQIGILPRRLSAKYWLKIINKALSAMKTIGDDGITELTTDRLRDMIVDDFRKRTLVATFYEHERLMQGWVYLDPASSTIVIEPNALCSYIKGRYPEIRIDGIRAFQSVLRHLGFRGKFRSVDGIERTLWYVRCRYLFDDDESWSEYMLDVSKDTVWEGNFRAFLTDEDSGVPELDEDTLEMIDKDAAVFLDTERRIEDDEDFRKVNRGHRKFNG